MSDQTSTIPKSWKMTTLVKVTDKITKGTTPTTIGGEFVKSGINFIKAESINDDGTFIRNKFSHIDKEIDDRMVRSRLAENDILFSIAGVIGRVAIVTKNILPANINQALAVIRPTTGEVYFKYLFYFLLDPRQKAIANSGVAQSVQANVNLAQVGGIEMFLPLLQEQRAIAAVLSSLDDKIELLREQNKILEATAQTIFKEWFVNFNFPGATGKMIDSELGEIPERWKVGKSGELVEIKNGFAFKSEDYIDDEQYPIIRTLNFEDSGYVNNKNLVYISYDKAKEYQGFNLKEFDLCVVMVGASLGKIALITKNNLPALQNQNMWSFKPKNQLFRFYCNFQSQHVVNQNITSASGSARDFFRKDHFYNIDILIPPDFIVQKFEKLMQSIYSKISSNISQVQILSALRDTLLPKLMKGEVRTKGFND